MLPIATALVENTTDQAPIDRLRNYMRDPAKQGVAADRIFQFLWQPAEGVSFITDAAKAMHNIEVRLHNEIAAWVGSHPGEAADIVFLLGAPAPEWASSEEDRALFAGFKPEGENLTRGLIMVLKRWSTDSGAYAAGETPIGAFSGYRPDKWAPAVLGSAAEAADQMMFRKKTPEQAARDILARWDPPAVPEASVGAGGTPTSAKLPDRFDFKDLYGEWGDLDVVLAGTKEELAANKGRLISIRLVTELEQYKDSDDDAEKLKSKYVDFISLTDITEPARPYGVNIPLSAAKQDIVLKSGGRKYTIKITPRPRGHPACLDLAPEKEIDAPKGFSCNQIELLVGDQNAVAVNPADPYKPFGPPSVEKLYQMRARRAIEKNAIVKLAGEEYYTLPQGTGKGAILFFPRSVAQALQRGGNVYEFDPAFIAYVNKMEGGRENISREYDLSGYPAVSLKRADGSRASPNGKWLSLVYRHGVWIPVETDADPQPQLPGVNSSTDTAHGEDGDSEEGKKGKKGKGDKTGKKPDDHEDHEDPAAEEWPEIDGYSPDEEHVVEQNKKLEEKGIEARLYFATEPVEPYKQYLVVFKDGKKRELPFYSPSDPKNPKRRKGWKAIHRVELSEDAHLLITENELGFRFSDLSKGETLPEVGIYDGESLRVSDPAAIEYILSDKVAAIDDKVKDLIRPNYQRVFNDGLRAGKSLPGGGKVPKEIAPKSPFVIEGILKMGKKSKNWVTMKVDGVEFQIYPGPLGLKARAVSVVLERNFGGVKKFKGFPEKLTAVTEEEVERVKMAGDESAALYRSSETGKLFVAFKVEVSTDLVLTTDPMPVPGKQISKDSELDSIHFKGFETRAQLKGHRLYAEQVYDEGEKKGAIGVYGAPTGKYNHCLGVVLWWGVSHAEAEQACREKKRAP